MAENLVEYMRSMMHVICDVETLYFEDGLKESEIAEIVGISLSTVHDILADIDRTRYATVH